MVARRAPLWGRPPAADVLVPQTEKGSALGPEDMNLMSCPFQGQLPQVCHVITQVDQFAVRSLALYRIRLADFPLHDAKLQHLTGVPPKRVWV